MIREETGPPPQRGRDRILITGGASGLGRAMAARFAAAGWRVAIADLDADAGERARVELAGAVSFHPLDVRDSIGWARVRQWCEREWGGLDVLVNNAGVAVAGRMEAVSTDDWDWILDINLKGVVRGCREFAPLFTRQGHGHLINMASMAGLMNLPAMSSYNVSKAGVISLSETLRYELAPHGVHTTVVCPAFVQTDLDRHMRAADPSLVNTTATLMAASKVTADDVAERVLQAVHRPRFLVLTHREGRIAWRVKRFVPALVDRVVARGWRRARARSTQAGGNSPATEVPVTGDGAAEDGITGDGKHRKAGNGGHR
ncbi:NADP-dependent 3-hydroxy acid dehydrogenase YdfG [Halopolyspora algeriensis]|uniref:NADP-dependent 3-hydroxy acid dehydrogenase YdfG n=1 Tax=Halopolyspora algeriensis TaxID=1500506 RepID=A0A368VYA1_9ACTN|nr:SDR family oxidoreductase [Halopolyspora algeriensis]RCW46297.1 NADP-dependent 3-hydroxy acid dehydrogenase YdfG [Halopolyspora algeriensis]TQM55697.1 NADP-dependent 3-hydroxy acid dehydrogenase YdfG [Halopolyspora algeriensis]